MIPKNINKEDVLKSIEFIKENGIPKRRNSRKFFLEFDGDHYPPKYVISIANKYANNEELNSEKFNGGEETNTFLRKLGFNTVEIPILEGTKQTRHPKMKKEKFSNTHHNERCPKCKETIRILLQKIYGEVKVNYKFNDGTSPKDFKYTSYYHKLKEIYEALQKHRRFKEFIRAKTLPNCDFFIPNPGFIVEFDESQHFTAPRKITLEKYPADFELGFSKEKWIKLCEKINAKDNDPPYRDEQRAWYDTLRDFLPAIHGLKPTVRLFSKDFIWCSLNPENPEDVEKFRRMIKKSDGDWEIKVREDPEPFLARIIIAGEWKGEAEEAKSLLEKIYEKWPRGKKVKFLISCGGFIQFPWPSSVSKKDIGDNKNPNPKVIEDLLKEAEKCIKDVITKDLRNKLNTITDYITLGVDSYKEKISKSQTYISKPHVELVFLLDLKKNKLLWTGKSYPTTGQEKGLLRISNLASHFFDTDIGKIMILGCHDLNIFSPRGKAVTKKEWRKNIRSEFYEKSRENKPFYVLHHPHTTVKVRTWLSAWNELKREIESVKEYAGVGRYYEKNSKRDPLEKVLNKTKYGNSIDFIIRV